MVPKPSQKRTFEASSLGLLLMGISDVTSCILRTRRKFIGVVPFVSLAIQKGDFSTYSPKRCVRNVPESEETKFEIRGQTDGD